MTELLQYLQLLLVPVTLALWRIATTLATIAAEIKAHATLDDTRFKAVEGRISSLERLRDDAHSA